MDSNAWFNQNSVPSGYHVGTSWKETFVVHLTTIDARMILLR